MASDQSAQSLLLALPDPCLMAVLQCCADCQRTLFSAARAHSRLHQAAVLVLRSITADITQQQQVDSVLLYLGKHGADVDHMTLRAVGIRAVSLRQLPSDMQLNSLQLLGVGLQLQAGGGTQGVLGSAGVAAFKQLRLRDCRVLDVGTINVVTAGLSLLPAGLQHLSIGGRFCRFDGSSVPFPTGVLQRLQQLTYLELASISLQGPDEDGQPLQPLQALTQLADLRLIKLPQVLFGLRLDSSTLSGAHHLTRLDMATAGWEADVLVGKTLLQHLHLEHSTPHGGPAGEAQLLSHLQHLQQLTHLALDCSLQGHKDSNPPAAAYSALTASSKLQYLNIRCCTLPADVWQHLFPASRQLRNLHSLNISGVRQRSGSHATAAEGWLVSCCPNLTHLDIQDSTPGSSVASTGLLTALQGLSGLRTLCVGNVINSNEGCNAVCQLTGLQELSVGLPVGTTFGSTAVKDVALLQLTQLKHLTTLIVLGSDPYNHFKCEAPGDKPVWRQLLRFCLDLENAGVAQQAATALAE